MVFKVRNSKGIIHLKTGKRMNIKKHCIPVGLTSSYRILWVFFIVFLPFTLTGQFYSQGEDPASVRWEKIQTENFKLIYPKGFYAEANRFANLLEYNRPRSSFSLKNNPAKIPVIIHTH